MTGFDSWEAAIRPPEDYLMHFRTKGSKNGVRRYQTESGEWTELGLEERRKREGWGEGGSRAVRKAQKHVEKTEKAIAKAEKHQAKKEARAERKAARAEKKRLSSLKGLTDEEMKKKLERAKMEAEYRDLTKKNTLIETGVKLIGKYLEYKDTKEQRALESNKQKLEMERLKTQQIQAKESTKQAKEASSQSKSRIEISKNEADKAKSEAVREKFATKGGKKYERRAQFLNAKTNYKGTTILGSLGKRANNRAKYIQENRMNPIEAKKHQRQVQMAQIQLQREKEKTTQAIWGAGKTDQQQNQNQNQSEKEKKKKK